MTDRVGAMPLGHVGDAGGRVVGYAWRLPDEPIKGKRYHAHVKCGMAKVAANTVKDLGGHRSGAYTQRVEITDHMAELMGLLESVAEDIRTELDLNRPRFNDDQYRAFLDWLMASDPNPAGEEVDEAMKDIADSEARIRGYDSWVVAYHEHQRRGPFLGEGAPHA